MFIFVIVVLAASLRYEEEGFGLLFEMFQSSFNRKYENEAEKEFRFKVFCENMRKMNELNEIHYPMTTYGVTKFSDMTQLEFETKVLGCRPAYHREWFGETYEAQGTEVPTEYDWRSHDPPVVNPVKDQEACGSCWCFSGVGAMEGADALATGTLKTFSEQQIVDCDKGGNGCGGGFEDQAIQYVIDNGGINLSGDYPYEGKDLNCRFSPSKPVAKFRSVTRIIESGGEKMVQAMMEASFKHGPVTVALNANELSGYHSGVWNPLICNKRAINHAVVLVGWGTEGGNDYWIIRNSWGTDGYFRIIRGHNKCGIETDSFYVTVH